MKSNIKYDFIGAIFETPKGGTLTVKYLKESDKRYNEYLCTCSICSLDTELWPDGSIVSTKRNLEVGSIPCGCSRNPQWTERQNKVRVERTCKEVGYIFHGWSSPYKGAKTEISLENPATDYKWEDATISGFLGGGRRDPSTRVTERLDKRKDDQDFVDMFMATGSFLEGTKFERLCDKVNHKSIPNYWKILCPICSSDEYVKEGLCTGVFTSYVSNLKKGNKPCRCSPTFRWNKEQREYQIRKICKEESLVFVGWTKEGYKNGRSEFKWICREGHDCIARVNSFVNSSKRCKICYELSGNGNGYYPKRDNDEDFLYLIDLNYAIKVGRSFDVQHRRNGIKSQAGLDELPKILHLYKANHKTIYKIEQEIHKILRERGFQYYCDWTTECFQKDCYTDLKKLLNNYLEKGTLTLTKEG